MRYAAEKRNVAESIAELCEIADGGNDIVAEAAAMEAGAWYASPATHVGFGIIAAGMLILAGGGHGVPLDYTELEKLDQGRIRAGGPDHGTGSGEVVILR